MPPARAAAVSHSSRVTQNPRATGALPGNAQVKTSLGRLHHDCSIWTMSYPCFVVGNRPRGGYTLARPWPVNQSLRAFNAPASPDNHFTVTQIERFTRDARVPPGARRQTPSPESAAPPILLRRPVNARITIFDGRTRRTRRRRSPGSTGNGGQSQLRTRDLSGRGTSSA